MIRTSTVVIVLLLPASMLAQPAAPKPEIPFGGTDFKQYYATGKLLLAGENPYDYEKVGEIQRALGSEDEPQVPYGPPTSLLPFIPLGRLDFPTAVHIQLGLNIALLAASGCLWGMMLFPGQPMIRVVGVGCVICWVPSLSLLGMGHVTGWTLFGFTGWCALMRAERPAAAGVVLAMSIIKPHLAFALVGYALVFAYRRGQWRMIATFFLTVLLMCVVMTLIRRTVWSEYLASLSQSDATRLFGSTLDGWGRYQFGAWFRVVSLSVTFLVWAVIFRMAWKEGAERRWAVVPALALAATPYAFSYDFILALPGFVLAVGCWLHSTRWRRHALLAGWLAVNAFYAFGKNQHWYEVAYFAVPWATAALSYWAVRERIAVAAN